MPKLRKKAPTVETISHPKSRKAVKLHKEEKKRVSREKSKLVHHMKQNMIGERLLWFRDHLPDSIEVCSREQAKELIETYISRFDDELQQIALKHSVGQRRNRQHASREDIVRLTRQREQEEYATCGLEMPNLLDSHQVKILQEWTGELRFLQNFTLCRLSKIHLESSVKERDDADMADSSRSITMAVDES